MPQEHLPHLKLQSEPERQIFSSTSRGGPTSSIPQRNRITHSQYLHTQYTNALQEIADEEHRYNLTRNGMYLEFKSDPGTDLVIKSLENQTSNIRLLNVREIPTQVYNEDTEMHEEKIATYATVYVPKAKSDFFLNRIEQYARENSRNSDKPKHRDLINSIANIRKALLIDSFWSDSKELIPTNEYKWCEVWLNANSEESVTSFETLLRQEDITSIDHTIYFPERAVKIIYVNNEKLELLSLKSDQIAEYRLAKENAIFWTEMTNAEQSEWVNDLNRRLQCSTASEISVCILDHGINNGHPLLSPMLNATDCHTIDPSWGTHDHHGHGTMMAGIAAYGDLENALATPNNININHFLESVKILPPTGHNQAHLWGYITKQGIHRAEITAPNRNRITCMAVTSNDTRDRGRPSSWSAALDALTSGAEDETKRLIMVSAGNAENFNIQGNYPDGLLTDSIHDPAQSWNAISVGAFTQLTTIADPDLSNYVPLAPTDGLSPFTTTSLSWEDKWPIKPEIVMEGGNLAEDPLLITECSDLSKLTTYFDPNTSHFTYLNMTSLATAQAAWFAAQIQLAYPNYWPETIRALMVHSANWTDALIQQFNINLQNKSDIKNLMRICGYGVPSLNKALHSASNSLTLIAESTLQPFYKQGTDYKTKDMHLFDLPWPREALLSLPSETEIEMRITLSYFIEPGPGEIGWKDKYRYASHMLRFDINSPGETRNEFTQRINQASREEDIGHPGTDSATSHWVIGPRIRNKGSIHSDIWKGSAAELAASNIIAVYPGIGWWRERRNLQKWNKQTRYSLIVSITTPDTEVDIYTPVAIQINTPVSINITT